MANEASAIEVVSGVYGTKTEIRSLEFGLLELKGLTWESSGNKRTQTLAKADEEKPAAPKPYTMPASGLTWQTGSTVSSSRPAPPAPVNNPDDWLKNMLNRVPVAR